MKLALVLMLSTLSFSQVFAAETKTVTLLQDIELKYTTAPKANGEVLGAFWGAKNTVCSAYSRVEYDNPGFTLPAGTVLTLGKFYQNINQGDMTPYKSVESIVTLLNDNKPVMSLLCSTKKFIFLKQAQKASTSEQETLDSFDHILQ